MGALCYSTKIKLHETDAAGFIFFSNLFKIAHDAYEFLLAEIGFPVADILSKSDYKLVIVHAEADFFYPLKVNDEIVVKIELEKIAKTSFILYYNIIDISKKTVAEVKTVHVSIDKINSRKKPLSKEFETALKDYL